MRHDNHQWGIVVYHPYVLDTMCVFFHDAKSIKNELIMHERERRVNKSKKKLLDPQLTVGGLCVWKKRDGCSTRQNKKK